MHHDACNHDTSRDVTIQKLINYLLTYLEKIYRRETDQLV